MFTSKALAERRWRYRERLRNPVPGRTPKEYMRINRTLDKIAERVEEFLRIYGYDEAREGLMPTDSVIVPSMEDTMPERHWLLTRAIEDYEEPYHDRYVGYLKKFHDSGIKATNRIEVATSYETADGRDFLLQKPIFSPLPCDEFGALPITLAQWGRIAPTLIKMRINWQWLPALRKYGGEDADPTFELKYLYGWWMVDTFKTNTIEELKKNPNVVVIDPRSEEDKLTDAGEWIGFNVYRDIIEKYSRVTNTE